MPRRYVNEGWWIGSLSLLIVSNLVLLYWLLVDKFGWENGASFGDFLFWITFFPGMILSPIAALCGVRTALAFTKTGQWLRSAVLAFLSGGPCPCAVIAWQAFLGGGR